MDHIREFLETSSIHGLSYIPTSNYKVVKAGWVATIAIGFGFAFFLIQSSFSNWSESPVATTIIPRSVESLEFPNVTVCPPKGINGALRYDLMRTANMSLKQTRRTKLKELLTKLGSRDEGKVRVDIVNVENQDKVIEGQMTFPEETPTEYWMQLAGREGSITSPGFGKNFSSNLYRQFKAYMKKKLHYTLHLEEKGILDIKVQRETAFEDELLFRAGDEYELVDEKLTWRKAETRCNSNGGHLVSINSDQIQQEVEQQVIAALIF